MRDLAALTIHLLVTIARLVGPGGARSVVAESLLVILHPCLQQRWKVYESCGEFPGRQRAV